MSEKIITQSLDDIMGDRFGKYSKYIIQDRALPDVRDGLKPVQRRILYAMYKEGNTYNKPYRKSAKTVGNVIGNYHPHGDTSVYDAMVRLSQEWKMRIPLVDMQGNNGSIDNDPAAAMRYTEARLSAIAAELLKDIDKETVQMALNFDDTEYEPTVVPAKYPNLLVNGATGISAGYATDIPPHNLEEVIDATIYRLSHPHCSLDKLMEFMKGPDFPTGAIVEGKQGIRTAFEKGRGKVVVRSKTEIIHEKNMNKIIVSEIPYEVNKAELVRKLDEIRFNKSVDGIIEVRDESDRNGLSIVIDLKKDVDVQNTLNYFFKNTDLQKNYNYNMVAIKDKRPVCMGIEAILDGYIQHQIEVITKRSIFDLNKAEERKHIVDGLIKAVSILDDVVHTIRHSKDKQDAKINIQTQFGFTEKQSEAIVTLQLYRLTNTDIVSLEKEKEELESLGLEDITLDEHGYLFATLPANIDKPVPTIGFIAHMDTSPDMSGKDVSPRIVQNYDGSDIVLCAEENVVLSPSQFPELLDHKGEDLIVTNGKTLLGADDKAGIAEIVSAIVYLKEHPEIKHGKIRIGFNPDEEIGLGAHKFDVEKFGCDWAYTMDGGEVGELEFENFNAASAKITFKGRNVHPGYAKNKMVNSIRVANRFCAMLPAHETPEHTEGYEGFYHLISFNGDVEQTTVAYIIRDHDRARFESRKKKIERFVSEINAEYGEGTATLELRDQYYNMREKIEPVMHIIDTAFAAMEAVGVKPNVKPIRGGTDGAQLSFKGLPCPNIFAGGLNFHGRYEFAPIQNMEKAMKVIVKIAELVAIK